MFGDCSFFAHKIWQDRHKQNVNWHCTRNYQLFITISELRTGILSQFDLFRGVIFGLPDMLQRIHANIGPTDINQSRWNS